MDGGKPGAGLCGLCAHQQIVRNTRGSVFSLCRRHGTQPEFPKYPRLPVIECAGFERGAPTTGTGPGSG